jgi:Zn-dependent M28 family amino/carboxypeptidase
MRAFPWISLLVLDLLLTGCQSAPALSSDAPAPRAVADFSGDAAYAELQALAKIGPRVTGTPGAAQARALIRAELEKIGLVVEEKRVAGPPGPGGLVEESVNLVTVIPGASPQRFVLTAPYDTRRFDHFKFVGANDGASAPALLLELARGIQARPLPYTTWIVFLDGEAAGAPPAPDAAAAPALAGSRALARELLDDGGAPLVRLVVSFQQVGDTDLRVARDLRSHRLFREEFWLAAARLGKTDAFRPGDTFESPTGSHLPFLEAGFRGVVLITDTSYGPGDPPGSYANSEDDTAEHCSAKSLASVGVVTREALDRIAERLAKIDRFSAPVPEAAAPPAPAPAPTPAAPPTAPPAPATAPAPPPAPERAAPSP